MANDDREQFNKFVAKYEQRSKDRPLWHMVCMIALILLGYATIREGLILLVAILVAIVVIFFMPTMQTSDKVFAGVVGAAAVARIVWQIYQSRLDMPPGLRIEPRAMPQLHKAVEQARKEVGGPRIHSVLLDHNLGAGMCARPWFGMFGPVKHHLVLGVPLIAALSPDQLRAVLAHEFSHMVGRRNHLNAWLARVNFRWNRALLQPGLKMCPISFWRSYLVKLNALLSVTSRNNEYSADAASARFTNYRTTGDALMRTFVLADYANRKYWPEVHKQARDLVTPPSNAFSSLISAIRTGKADADASEAIARVLKVKTAPGDSHPCLADRLRALNWPEPEHPLDQVENVDDWYPKQPEATAYDILVTPRVGDQAVSMIDQAWVAFTAPSWNYIHSEIERSKRELEKGVDINPQSADDLMYVASLHLHVYDFDAARPHLDAVLKVDPKHDRANLIIGRELLDRDDATGVEHLQLVTRHSPRLRVDACETLYAYYRDIGENSEADRYADMIDRHNEQFQKVQEEIAKLGTAGGPEVFRCDLPTRILDRLREDLIHHPDIGAVYVARVGLLTEPDLPYYVVGVTVKRPWYRPVTQAADNNIRAELANAGLLPYPYLVYVTTQSPQFHKQVKRVATIVQDG